MKLKKCLICFQAVRLQLSGTLAALVLMLPIVLEAEVKTSRPVVIVPSQFSTEQADLRLGDIAQINNSSVADEALVLRLREIELVSGLQPHSNSTLSGTQILEAIESAGISRESIAYSIPQIINIERQGRPLAQNDVLQAIRTLLKRDGASSMQAQGVSWPSEQFLPLGPANIEVEKLGEPVKGKMPLRVRVKKGQEVVSHFLASAEVDSTIDYPVLTRNIDRGMLVKPEDIKLISLNAAKQPADAITTREELIGLQAKSHLPAGSVIRKSQLEEAMLIRRGQRVSIVHESGLLRVSATGLALEDGEKGHIIRVQNESSKKIIDGRVTGPQIVEVEVK